MQHNDLTMWKKVSFVPLTLRMTIEEHMKQFIEDLRKDESGLEVVQVVLIILVGVLLIGALWAVLGDWLGNLWAQIMGETGDWERPDWN